MGSARDTTIFSRSKKDWKNRWNIAFAYISYLWERKDTLKVIHPWLEEAYWHLKRNCRVERI